MSLMKRKLKLLTGNESKTKARVVGWPLLAEPARSIQEPSPTSNFGSKLLLQRIIWSGLIVKNRHERAAYGRCRIHRTLYNN